jgi:predicted nucleic acid-binding protein
VNVIIDASVIIAVLVNEPVKEGLVALTAQADLLAPHSVHWEIGNAFSAMLKRERIGVQAAIEALRIYRGIPIRFVEVELEEALRIAHAHGMYAYDAYLIRCAEKYGAPLLSLDRGLLAAARAQGVRVLEDARVREDARTEEDAT